MNEPLAVRWRRRAQTIPSVLAATVIATFVAPVALPGLAVADIARGRRRLPSVRTYLFALQYLVNDSVEIVLAPVYWVLAGFGTRLGSKASIARHQRLQSWSVALLERRADQLLGLRIDIDDADKAALTPGPLIVISRHVSLFDASIPGLLFQDLGWQVRGIIMSELLADPGFDLLYGRLGSVFIPRDGGPEAKKAVADMSKDATDLTAFVIFPEGRLFRPSVRDRALKRLSENHPERAKRLEGIKNLLPPRPGGLVALLAANPSADVVLVDHRGLDNFAKLADVAKAAPVNQSISITVNRTARADIPSDPDGQVEWLDSLWLDLDRSLTA